MCVCVRGAGGGEKNPHKQKQDITYSIHFNGHANKGAEIGKLKLREKERERETDRQKESQTQKC